MPGHITGRAFRWDLALALAWLVLSGCGDDQDPTGARALLDRVRAEAYRDWTRAPGYESRRRARSPHSDQVDIFINEVVADAIALGEAIEVWPEGSIIVKDGYSGSKLELIALMEKRADGWYWAEFFGNDSKYSGRPSVCIDCHRGGADFVLAFTLPDAAEAR